MRKRVFRYRIIYLISVLIFPLLTLVMLFAMVSGLMNGANAVNFIYFTVTGILSLIITIKLFEKEKGVVRLMNICLAVLILPTVYRSLVSVLSLNFTSTVVIITLAVFVYLFIINKYRYRSEDFEEINEIGNPKNDI